MFIISLILGLFLLWISSFLMLLTFIIWVLGIIFVILFLIGTQGFTLHIIGRTPIIIPKELSDLVRFIREKRPQEVYVRQTKNQESIQTKEIIKEVVMIPCPYCGSLMSQTSLFCPNCGARRKV